MINFNDAVKRVLSTVGRLPPVEEALENVSGCVLAADARCPESIPPFSRSTMDGYAVRSQDFTATPQEFKVVEEIPAGKVPRRSIMSGQAARIFTGAIVPDGADAVIIQEDAQPLGDDRVRFPSSPTPGQFIMNAGDIARSNELLLEEGHVLTPSAIALLASVGSTKVPVYPRPRASVLATGDELVEPWVPPGPAHVRNSNAPMLVSALRAAGAEPEYVGIAKDNPASLRSLLEKGLSADILLVSGGVSVGTHDLVGRELENMGVEPVFTRVAVKPGKPLFFGRNGGTVVFGLPGNPASSLVGFELFVRPALYKMRGFGEKPPQFRSGELRSSIAAKRDRLTFLPATFARSPSGAAVELLKWAGSGDIKAMTHANCLVAIPPGKAPIPAGTKVDFVTFQSAGDCP